MKNDLPKKIFSAAMNCLLPSVCPVCGDNYAIFPQAVCGTCRSSFSDSIREIYNYSGHPSRTFSICSYNGIGGIFVKSIKYGGKKAVLEEFFRGRHGVIRKYLVDESIDIIVPVPLSPLKHLLRGFNQSELIAVSISRIGGAPLVKNVLHRKWRNTPQVKMSRSGRKKNVKGVFTVTGADRIKGMNVLLVDDVVTTGSTLCECSRVLTLHGAASVKAFTLARAF